MNTILKIKKVTKKYENNVACNQVSIDVIAGEFLAIIGESGSGKSTLVKMIAKLEEVTKGEIVYAGNSINNISKNELLNLRQEMQMVFQDTSLALNPKMKVIDIVTEPLINFKRIKKKEKVQKALELLEKVGLDETFLYKKSNQMSGGQRQRINIARALSLVPKLLLLDEPTSALDVVSQNLIVDLLKSLQVDSDLTIVFICHDIALVSKVADRIMVMKDGEVCQILSRQDLKNGNLVPYTKELLNATFNMNKCSCRFHHEREHREHNCC